MELLLEFGVAEVSDFDLKVDGGGVGGCLLCADEGDSSVGDDGGSVQCGGSVIDFNSAPVQLFEEGVEKCSEGGYVDIV